MNTVMRERLAARKLEGQLLDVALADKIFSSALTEGLKEYKEVLNIVYTGEGVPSTGKGIYEMFCNSLATGDSFKVYNQANDREKLFFSPETNLLYRTLHDIDHALHYKQGKGTTAKDSELFLNCLMAKRTYDHAINNGYTQAQAVLAFLCVFHDNVGQVYFYFENNTFCDNQKELTRKLLASCQGMEYLKNGMVTSAKQYIYGLMNECGLNVRL